MESEELYFSILDGTLGVHPTFFYESLWNLMGLLLIHFVVFRRKQFDGQLFLSYILWYGVGRTWIEGMRTDSLYFFGLELFGIPLRTSQVLALTSAVIAGVVLIWQLRKKHDPAQLFVNRKRAEQAVGSEEE